MIEGMRDQTGICTDCGKPIFNGEQVCKKCNELFWERSEKSCKEGVGFVVSHPYQKQHDEWKKKRNL